jgi:hypothetical protein
VIFWLRKRSSSSFYCKGKTYLEAADVNPNIIRVWLTFDRHQISYDNRPEGPAYLHFYDATNPEARQFVWEQVRNHYSVRGNAHLPLQLQR